MPGSNRSDRDRHFRDGRRRQFVPLGTEFPHDSMFVALQSRLGPAALGLWAAVLTAAKRAIVQGVIQYGSDDEFFRLIGIDQSNLAFTLDDFLKITGAHKQTLRRRRGDLEQIVLTRWEDLNEWPRTGSARRQNPRSDTEKSAPDAIRSRALTETETETETETATDAEESSYLSKARQQVKERISNGKDITNAEGYARKLAADPEWRSQVDTEAAERADATAQREAITRCRQCDQNGLVHLLADSKPTTVDDPNSNQSARCTHEIVG